MAHAFNYQNSDQYIKGCFSFGKGGGHNLPYSSEVELTIWIFNPLKLVMNFFDWLSL